MCTPPSTDVGAALNLIQIGLQRLHVRVPSDRPATPQFNDAAAILLGDYLTSGAFRLISSCPDVRVLRVIGAAMTTTCEREVEAMLTTTESGEVSSDLLVPLGDAAGRCGGLLAGYSDQQVEQAATFGRVLVVAHAWAVLDVSNARRGEMLPGLLAEARAMGRCLSSAEGRDAALALVEALAEIGPASSFHQKSEVAVRLDSASCAAMR